MILLVVEWTDNIYITYTHLPKLYYSTVNLSHQNKIKIEKKM